MGGNRTMTEEQLQKFYDMAKPRSEEAIRKAEERKTKRKDKELLLQDLCGRLPYSPICHIMGENGTEIDDILTTSTIENLDVWVVKPYLRPISSMTEEEILELYKIAYDTWYSDSLYYKNNEWISFRTSIKNNNLCFINCIWLSDINKVTDWLNKNMFDYHGLIPKDLALSTEKFNPYKK